MPPPNPANGLPTQEDKAVQERVWVVQRVAWALMLALLVAALAGLTGGGGPLTRATAETGEATIDYPRIARWQAAEEMKVTFTGLRGEAQVTLPEDFIEIYTVEAITPQPREVAAIAGGQRYTFDLGEEDGTKIARFAIRANKPALPTHSVAVAAGSEPAAIEFLVLP